MCRHWLGKARQHAQLHIRSASLHANSNALTSYTQVLRLSLSREAVLKSALCLPTLHRMLIVNDNLSLYLKPLSLSFLACAALKLSAIGLSSPARRGRGGTVVRAIFTETFREQPDFTHLDLQRGCTFTDTVIHRLIARYRGVTNQCEITCNKETHGGVPRLGQASGHLISILVKSLSASNRRLRKLPPPRAQD